MELVCTFKSFFENCYINYYKDGKKYTTKNDEDKISESSKLELSELISSYWSNDSNSIKIEQNQDIFVATYFLPIYEEFYLELYAKGNSEIEAKQNVINKFQDYCKFYNKYEQNLRRNEIKQIKGMHRFAYIPNNEDFSWINDDFRNGKWIFFEDNDLNFRDLAISIGIPNDARADEPIFGYIEKDILNKNISIVFFKYFFIKNQKKYYELIIKEKFKDIIEYYNIKDYDVYLNMETNEEKIKKEIGFLTDDLVFKDYQVFYKKKKIII